LRASDLIKNYVFRTLQDNGCDVETLYERSWSPLEAEWWSGDVRQGRLTRPRLDAFMGYFLVVLLQQEMQAHQLFQATRGWVGTDAHRAEQFLSEVSRYADVYDRLERLAVGDKTEKASLARIEAVDTTTLTPVLMWLLANVSLAERILMPLLGHQVLNRKLPHCRYRLSLCGGAVQLKREQDALQTFALQLPVERQLFHRAGELHVAGPYARV
jgi:hypothetical protein